MKLKRILSSVLLCLTVLSSAVGTLSFMTDRAGQSGAVRVSSSDWTIKPYLTFSSPNAFTLATANAWKNWDGTLYYSTDARSWSVWTGTSVSSAAGGGNNHLYLRGTGNTTITRGALNYRFVLTGSGISCNGNIENLLDWQTVAAGGHPTMTTHAFSCLFRDCAALVAAPDFLAPTATEMCCAYAFMNCSGLVTAPRLSATVLAQNCYRSMFDGCTSLVSAPILPATTLATGCYYGMFANCSTLTTPPTLPAKTLAQSCYQTMFYKCTLLTTPPKLSATTMASQCYYEMFRGCATLTTVPALPATTLATACYQGMFSECTNLTSVPALPATALVQNCYTSMFANCSKIKASKTQEGEYQVPWRIPTAGTVIRAAGDFDQMLTGTTGTWAVIYMPNEPTATLYLSTTNRVIPAT